MNNSESLLKKLTYFLTLSSPTHGNLRISTLYFSVLVLSITSCKKHPAQSEPNIILIMADDLGYGDLSCFGNHKVQTPHIDSLAAKGIVFTDYHSNGAVCSPTRAAMLTGKYQQRVGIPEVVFTWTRDSAGLALSHVTLAELFQKQNYSTGIFGKWHLGYQKRFNPVYQGFDEFRGFVAGNVDYHSYLDNQHVYDWWNDTSIVEDSGYTTDLITEYALTFIEKNKRHPFFLYVPYPNPHDPYQSGNDLAIRIKGKKNRELNKEAIEEIYPKMIESMDDGIGNIMEKIQILGLPNTFIFFCSDNGANRNGSNGALRGFKGSLYEGGHRVPAIAYWPGKIKPGQISSETILSMDLFPTLLDIAGIDHFNNPIDGVSILPHIQDGESIESRSVYWAYRSQKAVRYQNLKLLMTKSDTAIYDLREDLAETQNIYSSDDDDHVKMLQSLQEWEENLVQE